MATSELEISQQSKLATQPDLPVVASFTIAIAFLLRLVVAASTFFDPDEAFHYALGHQASFQLAYRASLSSAHPPLLILLVYGLRGLGNSELMLRLPSVLAGTLSCWLTYKWLRTVASSTVALTGLVLLSLSPPLFTLESELRQYSLLLMFISAALYWFEQSVQDRSIAKMWLFSAALWLALTAHYGALLFAISMGLYALLRFVELRSTLRLILTWSFGQAIFLALAVFFYKTHVPVVEQGISESWLRKSFFHRGDHVISFLLVNTYRFFHFLFGQPVIGAVMLLLFIAGLLALLRPGQMDTLKFRRAGFVIVFALCLSWALALGGLYPFGGTRHGVFLLPFIVLTLGTALVTVLKGHARTAPVIAGVLVGVCSVFPVPTGPHITPPNQNILLMRRAIEHVQHTIAARQLVLADQQTLFPFRYYFCRDDVFPFQQNPQNFTCSGYHVHKSEAEWDLSAEHLQLDIQATQTAFAASPRASVLVFQTGWTVNADRNLRGKFQQAGCAMGTFGNDIVACLMK